LTAAEVLVVVLIVGAFLLLMLLALPRQRETARAVDCRRNLMRVGVALALFDRNEGHLPTVPPLASEPVAGGGPLKTVLASLVLPDLTGLTDVASPPAPQPGQVPGERPLPGFVCPSDPYLSGPLIHPAPISYRATTGDLISGATGAFAPGRVVRLSDIEAGDGLSFTAAFSERLIGRGPDHAEALSGYRRTPGPLAPSGCPPAPPSSGIGDAGASWAEGSWRSSLYNHTLTPNGAPSCVSADGREARMGASSGHAGGVNVLTFDGGVRTVSPTVSPPIWNALATTHTPTADSPPEHP
jgi:prepilin-type processing-associated H-X9-DG protein